ncbi:NusA-like transcription termination signal-binding factor [Cuniculiplasma sp. SKW3]|uniref:NusA-like transcription termination signal-binding factor n=1 Tax=unclassified Cuniculiplasma TaxID=2619706 RepID=UPI003FCF9E2C
MSTKGVTIDNRIMELRALFDRIARVEVKECMENEDMVLFIVPERKMAEMFKRNQNVVANLKEKINKHILIAEYSRDLISFVRNLYFRFGIKEISVKWEQGQIDIQVAVDPNEVGKAIGKEGRNVKLLKDAISRFTEIRSLSIKQP